MRRSILVAFAVASAAVLLGSCADDAAGPRQATQGRLAVVPNFGALANGIVDVARGRFVLTRIPGGTVAADTVVDIPADADSVDLAITVPVFSPGETFTLTIRLISPAGDTVFAGGPIEVSPTTSGVPVPVEVPFAYVGTGANAAGIQILNPDTSSFSGEILLLTAVALDSSEAPLFGTPIGWESLDTARVRVTPDAQFRGVATGGSQRGVARLVATLVTGQTDTVLVTNQPLPTALVAESGGNQSGLAGSPLPQPLVARVTAGDGQGVVGVWVRFAVTSGGGTVSADSVLTDATGRASASYTLARTFQAHVVTATTARLGTASAVFNATLIFAPPASLEIVAGDGQTAVAGSAVAAAPQVRVRDAQGLPVPGVTVTFTVTGGSGIVAGGTPVTDTLGLAAVSSWTLGTTAGPNALQAAANALTVSFIATGVAGPASQLVLVSGDAQAGAVGALLSLPLVVRATDANDNPVAGAGVDWNATAGNVSAPTTVTDADGLTQVTWTLGTAPGPHAATATLNGTAATVGFTATAGAGAATRLAFTVEPTQVREDSVITPAVQVTAYDAFDNVATGFTGSVTLGLLANPGAATLGGTTSVAAVAGVASFADLSLNAFAVGYTLLATATGLESDTSAAFTVLGALGQAFWANPAGGNWSVGANWSTGAAPGATDTARIILNGTYTVTLDQDASAGALVVGAATGTQTLAQAGNVLTVGGDATFGGNAAYVLSGGTIGGGAFTNAGTMTWSGGSVAGTTSITNTGTMVLAGAAAKTLGSTAVLTNAGAIVHSGTGSLVLSVGSVVTNAASAVYDFQADAAIDWVSGTSPEPFVNNQGTIRKSGGTGQSFIDQLQNLGGTLEVQTGELELRSYDGTTNISTGGTFIVAGGAVLDLSSEQDAAHDEGAYQGTYTGAGGGTVLLDNGVLHVGTGVTFNLPALMFQWQGGTISDGAFANANAMTWTGGTLAGSATLLNSGTLTLPGVAAKTLGAGAGLTSTGTILHTGTGSLVVSVGAVVTNAVGAVYEFQTDAAIDWVSGTSPEPFVTNQGTIRKTAGTGQSFIDQLRNQGGTIEVQTGELELRSYDGTTNTSTGGTFNVAAGATLDLTSEQDASHDEGIYQGTYTGSGGGTVLLNNGVLHVGTGAAFNLPGAMLQWQGGTIADGVFTNAGTMTASSAAAKALAAGATLSNTGRLAVEAGTLVVAGGFSHAAGATLQGGGTLDLTNATVTFAGNVAPGTSPGILNITTPTAGLTQPGTSTFTIELDGPAAGAGYDRLNFSGNVTLNGNLMVTRSFTPNLGDRFAIMTFAGRTNQFANVSLPLVDGLVLDTLWAIDADPIDTLYIVANAPPAPKVLFAGDSAGISLNSGIFSVNPDGSNQFQITTEGPPGETSVHPRWSPDGTRITYSARSGRSDPNQLHIRTADGSVVWHLTSTADTSAFRPRYSPNGLYLAFECGNGDYPNTAQDVCVVQGVTNPVDGMADGDGKEYVTDAVDPTLGGSGAFAWNPQNPDQLAVIRDSVFIGPTAIVGSVIWLVKFDGSGATPLGTKVILDGAGAPVQVYSMDWAPDGSFIAFEGTSGGTRSIFRIEVATGIVTQLTSQSVDFGPVVSPDATEILFGRQNDLWTLMKISADGSNLVQMSDYMNFAPAQAGWDWSPDGTEIAVTEDATTGGVVISKIRRETTATSFFSDALAGKLGRRGSFEIQDRQPSWRP